MFEPVPRKCCNFNEPVLLQCAELVLPWLAPSELANVSLTCKAFLQISNSITLRRSSDASRKFEKFPVPFRNTVDNHPYAYFLYTSSLLLRSPASQLLRQSWGSSNFASAPSLLPVESVSLVDELGQNASGCYCGTCGDSGSGFGCPCLSLDGLDVASECGPGCRCGSECVNRSSQKGIAVGLKIVRDRRKGWGLYADQLIQKGQFVCEYAVDGSVILLKAFLFPLRR